MCVPPALCALCLVALVLSGTRCPAELEALAPEKINEIDGIERVYIAHRISNEKGTLLPDYGRETTLPIVIREAFLTGRSVLKEPET
jgi:hypothetical protein